MLFNSPVFLFAFLPFTLAAYYGLGRVAGGRAAVGWLVAASLFYYGWWNPAFLLLIGASIVVNFGAGRLIMGGASPAGKRSTLVLGVVLNLGLLAYFKYANFFVQNLAALSG